MIINRKLVFEIIINLADLQYILIIYLAKIKFCLKKDIQFIFMQIMIIINLIIMAKFFYIIYNALFISLLAAAELKKGLLRPILDYFAIVKTNSYDMLYLHCFIWLKKVSYLAILHFQIQNNYNFYQKLCLFLKHIINCFAYSNPHLKTLHYIYPNTNNPIMIFQLTSLLKSDSKSIIYKV